MASGIKTGNANKIPVLIRLVVIGARSRGILNKQSQRRSNCQKLPACSLGDSHKKKNQGSRVFGKSMGHGNYGAVGIKVPRDCAFTFEPIVAPKRSCLAECIEELVLSLYAQGMSTRDIEDQLRDIYKLNHSESTISNITARISEDILEWQQRPLEEVYSIEWPEGIVLKCVMAK